MVWGRLGARRRLKGRTAHNGRVKNTRHSSPDILTFASSLLHYIFMFNLILFGPPGSGKGTQSENIVNTYQLYHISTGELLRWERDNLTPLGIEANKYIAQGMLV